MKLKQIYLAIALVVIMGLAVVYLIIVQREGQFIFQSGGPKEFPINLPKRDSKKATIDPGAFPTPFFISGPICISSKQGSTAAKA
jgi:hypothetical protein